MKFSLAGDVKLKVNVLFQRVSGHALKLPLENFIPSLSK